MRQRKNQTVEWHGGQEANEEILEKAGLADSAEVDFQAGVQVEDGD
ncbi:hypothetical protein KAI54_02145 [Candidatus Gracilibacteria bacterium]|nr:hypothetical protein [Candidatus Gracilibacteria bacterium]